MKNWQVTYFLLPGNENENVQIRKRRIEAPNYDRAWQIWTDSIERENLNIDPVWKLIELQ